MFDRTDKHSPANIPLCFLFIVSLIGILIILWLTRWGVAINNDSTVYIASALNFSRGAGFSEWAANGQLKPMNHFPPLYPLLLAYANKLGLDILVASRWLNALLFGLNIFLTGLISAELVRWRLSAVISSLLLIFSTHLLLIHMMAVSEPLFILLFLLGIWCFLRYMENSSFLALLLSGFFLGLAALSRYIGVVFIISVIIFTVSFRTVANKTTLLRVISFVLVSFSGLMLWVARNIHHTSSVADRSFAVYPMAKLSLLKGLQTILWWLMFEVDMNYLGYVRFISFFLILFLLFKYWAPQITALSQKRVLRKFSKSYLFILLCLASYMISLLSSILFLDPAIMLDYRILSPAYVLLLLIFPTILKPVKIKIFFASIFIFWASVSAAYGIWWGLARTDSVSWDAYQRFNWRKIGSLALLDGLPNDAVYLTNDPELLYALSGKVPSLLNRDKLFTLMDPEAQTPLTKNRPDIYMVYFKPKVFKPFLPSLEDIRDIPGLNVISDSPHIYICQFN
ncbi:MAG: glycosyltransferase family 39 protein [Candidatus Edwardsbacteria bacterium]|nr:glycosyltransferase family 39 protein [Candidatus Edwardsbacteria bacterium]